MDGWWLWLFFAAGLLIILLGTTGRTRSLLQNTMVLSGWTVAMSLPVGTTLAWLITRTDVPLKRVAIFALAVLLFVPLYLQTAAWDSGFGLQGWFQQGTNRLGHEPLLSGWRGAIWVHVMAAIPWVTLIVSLGLRTLPREWEDSALIDAQQSRVFRSVVLPQLAGALVVASLWVFVTTAGEITVTDVFQIRTYAEEIYIGFARDAPEEADVVFANSRWSGTLLVAWLAIGALAVCDWLWPANRPAPSREQHRYRLGRHRAIWGLLVAMTLFVLIVVPVGSLVYHLGLVVEQSGEARVRVWSLAKAVRLLLAAPGSFRQELGWSLLICQLAAVSCLLLAIPAAWCAARHRTMRWIVAVLVGLTLAVPGPILGMSIVRLFSISQHPTIAYLYDHTVAAPWLALCVRGWPFATLIMWEAFRTVSQSTLDSSALAGAGSFRQLVTVVLPQRVAAVGCAWFVTIAVTAGELTASILVVPPGVTTLSIRIFGLVHYGVEDRLAALCLCTIFVFVGLGAIVFGLFRWIARQEEGS